MLAMRQVPLIMNDNSQWHAPSSRGCAGSEVRNQAVFSFVRDWQYAVEIENVIAAFAHRSNIGFIVPPDFTTVVNRSPIIASAARYKLPAIYPFRLFVTDGGLMSYGINLREMYVRSASYVDRILRGERPGELPVQAPTKYELVINLKAAKALGLDVPPTLLALADEMIQ